MESKKLNGYEIEFITKYEYCNLPMYEDRDWLNDKIYVGLVSDISEELAEKIVDFIHDDIGGGYKEYNDIGYKYTSKQSFQTLSDLPYCVITKIK